MWCSIHFASSDPARKIYRVFDHATWEIGGTLAGALLLGIIFTILNFENGMGWISLSAYWQSVVRGVFLFVVVVLQAKLSRQAKA